MGNDSLIVVAYATIRRLLCSPWLSRSWWALLAGIHILPIVKVSAALLAGEGGWMSLSALLGVLTFFVLKLVDARIVRWTGGRGGTIAFLLVCALVHREAVLIAAEHAPVEQLPAVVVTALGVEAVRRRRAIGEFCRRLADDLTTTRAFIARFVGVVESETIPSPQHLPISCRGSRAPPR